MRLVNVYLCFIQIFLIAIPTLCLNQNTEAQCVPLLNGFAHNDYWHKRPLLDALDNGYTYIEADVYERDGKLIVAHILPILNRHRTLDNTYLDPLLDRVINNHGSVYTGYANSVTLMIDVKSDADRTYFVLDQLLKKYSKMLSSYSNGQIHVGAVTIVISGNKPVKLLSTENSRYAFVDEDLRSVKRDTLSDMYMMSSCKYSKLLNWRGVGSIPSIEKQRLCAFISAAHEHGRKVRLWASPEDTHVWKTLLDCGVDLINTDKLKELKNFLLVDKPFLASSNQIY
ncbi:phosphatidylinositol-specific phospholipase C/glycerophosphodiester phosphodiesterase family protein [Mucilaginibacter sp.]